MFKSLSVLKRVLEGYGSFFALNHPLSKILIFVAAMLQPVPGLFGLVGATSVITARRILRFENENERIEIVNGILLGMLIGSMYAPDWRSLCLVFGGGCLIVVASAVVSD